MGGFEFLADGHHVDEAGNLISCTYLDFRAPAERYPITALQKASSKPLVSRLRNAFTQWRAVGSRERRDNARKTVAVACLAATMGPQNA